MSPLINFSGIASGIDSSSLIKAALDQQRKSQIAPLQSRIDELTGTNTSFDELSTLLSKLQTAAGKFRAINAGSIAKTTTSSNEAVATATASNSAQSGSFTVTVAQLARGSTYSFSDRYSASTDVVNGSINNGAPAANRTLSIAVGNGSEEETVAIELTNTTTIGDVVSQFNAASTKAQASLVNVGTSSSPSYAIVINSDHTGIDKGKVTVTVGSEIQTAGTGAFNTGTATLTQATNAQFSLNGINGTIERGSNSISDLLTGVTFNLSSIGSSNITVTADAEASKGSVKSFVEAYNNVVKYIQENDLVSQEQDGGEIKNIFGTLSQTSVDDNILSQLRGALLSAGISGRGVNTLADIGITTERDGTIKFNEEAYTNAFSLDPEGIRIVTERLGESLSSVDGVIAQFTRFNGLIGVSKNANTQSIASAQDRISNLEAALSKQEGSLTSQYARLESLIGRLNQQQSALSGLMP